MLSIGFLIEDDIAYFEMRGISGICRTATLASTYHQMAVCVRHFHHKLIRCRNTLLVPSDRMPTRYE